PSFIALGINEAAYMAEIIRGGILAVPHCQVDAARSIGMRNGAVFRRVILPQTVKSVIPPTGNQVIGLLKASSLVSVIGGGDLLTRAEYIYGQNFDVIPLLLVASLWYLLLVTLATIGQFRLERWVDTSRPDKAVDRQVQIGRRILNNITLRRGG
ncbi:MAG: amino acid ABC transporter permease, partial [Acidimicrobiales bacterium]